MYENENQSFDNREQDYHYTNTPEQQAPTRPRKKNTSAARIAKKAPMSKRDAAPFETPEPCGRGTRQGKY